MQSLISLMALFWLSPWRCFGLVSRGDPTVPTDAADRQTDGSRTATEPALYRTRKGNSMRTDFSIDDADDAAEDADDAATATNGQWGRRRRAHHAKSQVRRRRFSHAAAA